MTPHKQRILVLGTGGREHAIAWKLSQSPLCEQVWLHPGNAGTESLGLKTLAPAKSLSELVTAAKELKVSLVVIGPEAYLDQGYSEAFRKEGVLVVGPGKDGARLETSKVFSKEFMTRAKVPTAPFAVVDSEQALLSHSFAKWPTVLKLDGLAAGKGVVLPSSLAEVKDFANRIWKQGEFGTGPHRVLIEDFTPGNEISYIGFCDGTRFLAMASATDYKRVGDGGTGPNTGGMGCVSPSPFLTPELERRIETQVIEPVLLQLQKEGIDYRGFLYVGLMITPEGVPSILEFNARLGDPETEVILPRLKTDFVELLVKTAQKTLTSVSHVEWDPRPSVYVVACAEGYPATPKSGDAITALPSLGPDETLFFSGVAKKETLVTSGGRVLGVGALGQTKPDAVEKAYRLLSQVRWRGMHFRRDIGR